MNGRWAAIIHMFMPKTGPRVTSESRRRRSSTAIGVLRLRYQPRSKPFWIEGYTNLAGKQDQSLNAGFSGQTNRRGAFAGANSKLFPARCLCPRNDHARDQRPMPHGGRNFNRDRRNAGSGAESSVADRRSYQRRGMLTTTRPFRFLLQFRVTPYLMCAAVIRLNENHQVNLDLKTSPIKAIALPAGELTARVSSVTVRYQYRF